MEKPAATKKSEEVAQRGEKRLCEVGLYFNLEQMRNVIKNINGISGLSGPA